MTKGLSLQYCKNYVKGLQDFILEEPLSITQVELYKMKQEIRTWQNVIRVLQTSQYSYYTSQKKGTVRGESIMPLIVRTSKVNNLIHESKKNKEAV